MDNDDGQKMIKKSRRPKTCPQCEVKFTPVRPIQPTCAAFDCMIGYIDSLKDKKQRKTLLEGRLKLKSRTDWLNDAQDAVNKWIRLVRDKDLPCITCSRHMKAKQTHLHKRMAAGHYIPRGRNSPLRFHEDNINKQCFACNAPQSGMSIKYRQALVLKIGEARVEWLEGPHPPAKFTIDDAKIIIDKYKQLLRGQNGTQDELDR